MGVRRRKSDVAGRLEVGAVQELELEVGRLWHESRGAPIANPKNRWEPLTCAYIHDRERISNVFHPCVAEIGARETDVPDLRFRLYGSWTQDPADEGRNWRQYGQSLQALNSLGYAVL